MSRILIMWRNDLFKMTVRPVLFFGLIWFALQAARAVYRHDLADVVISAVTFLLLGSVAVIWWIRNKDRHWGAVTDLDIHSSESGEGSKIEHR